MQVFRICPRLFTPVLQARSASTTKQNNEINPVFQNRNPRNLERMRIAYKPDGYHVDKPGRNYWHKLDLKVTGKYVTASINHFENGEVLRASTSEWCIKKYLYSTKDTSAFVNLGRVLGFRCLQTGITEISCNIEPPKKDGKIALFLQALKESGVQLEEPPQFFSAYPWDLERPEKPWEVVE
ncbi:39S ribosomal protein L18, mitochondrial [Anthonomus grandis grandis]|uniref:39S ribosomal protein L18, mitochondrial n=1 Tax=Anthonomus grandis grandis TaxID=2921223 RepID=UPI0021665E57|nr:39S ribosomal protein L18, mitochondrial [Anthonomus grandis grandis]